METVEGKFSLIEIDQLKDNCIVFYAFLFFTILNSHRIVSNSVTAPTEFVKLLCQLRIVKNKKGKDKTVIVLQIRVS